ncbi:MAG: Uma2 family endonuclease [Lachnospiraceae bacterium]|nr:Uma2 family endonuclease [Lachnospiraceae bacterium]
MGLDLHITDMAGATPDHSTVITNFVNMVYNQLKDSTCRVYPDNVQYKWKMDDGSEKIVIPDVSINCQIRSRKGNSFLNAPQFVLEVLSPSTAKYDRTEKKEIYRSEEIPEYWIIDIRKRMIELYDLDYKNGEPEYYLIDTITKDNAEELHLIHFPHIKIDFDQLFDGVE